MKKRNELIRRTAEKIERKAAEELENVFREWIKADYRGRGALEARRKADDEVRRILNAYHRDKRNLAKTAGASIETNSDTHETAVLESLRPIEHKRIDEEGVCSDVYDRTDVYDRMIAISCGEEPSSRIAWRRLAACMQFAHADELPTIAAAFYSVDSPANTYVNRKLTEDRSAEMEMRTSDRIGIPGIDVPERIAYAPLYYRALQSLISREVERRAKCVEETKEYMKGRSGMIPEKDVPEWFANLSTDDLFEMRLASKLAGPSGFSNAVVEGKNISMTVGGDMKANILNVELLDMETETGAFIAFAMKDALKNYSPSRIRDIRNVIAYDRLLGLFASGMVLKGDSIECGKEYDSQEILDILRKVEEDGPSGEVKTVHVG